MNLRIGGYGFVEHRVLPLKGDFIAARPVEGLFAGDGVDGSAWELAFDFENCVAEGFDELGDFRKRKNAKPLGLVVRLSLGARYADDLARLWQNAFPDFRREDLCTV